MTPKTKHLTAFYAHSMTSYGTPQERRDIATLRKLGFRVINPGAAQYEDYSTEAFKTLTLSADVIAFRAFPDGTIGAGVGLGIRAADEANIPVIELGIPKPERIITRDATRVIMGLRPLKKRAKPDAVVWDLIGCDPLDHDWGNS